MTPAARLSAAADILDSLDLDRPVDPQLREWARGNRYAGSKDRRAIADRVYTVIRRRRSVSAQGGSATGRGLVLGSLAAVDALSSDEISAFCRGGYGLAALDEAERAVLSRTPDWASEAERLDWPDWLMPSAREAFGEDTETELDALRQRAPVDLRVNTLKTDIADAIRSLRDGGLSPERGPIPTALRLPPNAPILGTRAWQEGLIELQDAGSQAVAAMVGAKSGETVLDYCAGGGGKTLALAAAMENTGVLIAWDENLARMIDLPDRAERAGATCVMVPRREDMPSLGGRCDRILVDAPCSGSGSWRRDPAGKWRLTPEMLGSLIRTQDEALGAAARYLRSGGALVYATCSILNVENEDRVANFLDTHPEFSLEETLHLHPARDGCDGFYAARLVLTGC